jgi:hypothetical protein
LYMYALMRLRLFLQFLFISNSYSYLSIPSWGHRWHPNPRRREGTRLQWCRCTRHCTASPCPRRGQPQASRRERQREKDKGREEGRAGVSKKTSGTHPTHVSTQTTKAICNASLSLEASRRGAGRFFVWPSASFCLSIYAREEVCFSMSLLLPW